MENIKSFVIGIGRVLDIYGTMKTPSYFKYFQFHDLPSMSDPDLDAIAKDWKIVGNDIWGAYQKVASSDNPSIG